MKSVPTKKNHLLGAALVAAALSLPSYNTGFAEATPEHGVVAFKYLNYRDKQAGDERMNINAYTTSIMMPVAEKWTISSSFTYDFLTGASPHKYSVLSSGASISEKRNAYDISATRYLDDGSWTFGGSYSVEFDYTSRSGSIQRSISTADKNTTVTFGGSYTSDTIHPWRGSSDRTLPNDSRKNKLGVGGFIGVTQILTKEDIVQFNIGFSNSRGYLSDPYKWYDNRPDKRNITTYLGRWNHHFDGTDGTSRMSYRYYTDSYNVKAHTLTAEYVQPMANHFTVIPSFRYSSQSKADFYYSQSDLDALNTAPINFAPVYPNIAMSTDERLATFGALTFGIKVEKKITDNTTLDIKFEKYDQSDKWALWGKSDPAIKPFSFRSIQLGVSQVL